VGDENDNSTGEEEEDSAGEKEEFSVGSESVGNDDRAFVEDEGELLSGDAEEDSIGENEEEPVVDNADEDINGDYVKEKFPRSKLDGLKFVMDYRTKSKAALKGTVLERPIKVDVWNGKYLLPQMRERYDKVVVNVILHTKKLRQVNLLNENRNVNAAKRKVKASRPVPPSKKTKPTLPTPTATTQKSSQPKPNVHPVPTSKKTKPTPRTPPAITQKSSQLKTNVR